MKQVLIVASMIVSGSTNAQVMCSQSETFGAELKLINSICFTNEHCKKEIAEIQRCLPEDYANSNGSAKQAIAKLEQKIVDNNKQIALEKKQASAPGVKIGMTPNQVINDTSWGAPKKINRTTTSSGVREQWVYDHCGYSRCYGGYLYFTNGVLTAIQN